MMKCCSSRLKWGNTVTQKSRGKELDFSEKKSWHSLENKIGRVLWGLIWCLLFRMSPRLCYGWRRLLLRLFRADIGRGVKIHPSVTIWAPWKLSIGDFSRIAEKVELYAVDQIIIGKNVTISKRSFLCGATHCPDDPAFTLLPGTIQVRDKVWIAAEAFIAPGVTLGEGSVAGARAAVFKDVAGWTIVGGNPARFLRERARV